MFFSSKRLGSLVNFFLNLELPRFFFLNLELPSQFIKSKIPSLCFKPKEHKNAKIINKKRQGS